MMRESRISSTRASSRRFSGAAAIRQRSVRALVFALAIVACGAATAAAQGTGYTRQTVAQWLANNANAKPLTVIPKLKAKLKNLLPRILRNRMDCLSKG